MWEGWQMSTDRRVDLVRTSRLQFTATNARGGTLSFGSGDHGEFTPVELLLVALAGCTGMDVDAITSKRAEATGLLTVKPLRSNGETLATTTLVPHGPLP